jgi:hypothetical protein
MQSRAYFVASILMGLILCVPFTANSAEEQDPTHKKLTGVVVQRAGGLGVKTPNGSTYQTNENASRRHGHEPFKIGDEVSFILDANNIVIDMHLKGEEGEHQFVTGKLVYMGRDKKVVKLQTAEGDKEFPLERLEVKAGSIAEGTMVTVELNEAGTVIDLHRAK